MSNLDVDINIDIIKNVKLCKKCEVAKKIKNFLCPKTWNFVSGNKKLTFIIFILSVYATLISLFSTFRIFLT